MNVSNRLEYTILLFDEEYVEKTEWNGGWDVSKVDCVDMGDSGDVGGKENLIIVDSEVDKKEASEMLSCLNNKLCSENQIILKERTNAINMQKNIRNILIRFLATLVNMVT